MLWGQYSPTEISQEALNKYLNDPQIRASWRPTFEEYIRQIPLVPATNFVKYILQLHYCITDNHIKPSDITYDYDINPSHSVVNDDNESGGFNYAKIWSQENSV